MTNQIDITSLPSQTRVKSWRINSFESIGLPDPFPFTKNGTSFFDDHEKLIYKKNRYMNWYSPNTVFLPSD